MMKFDEIFFFFGLDKLPECGGQRNRQRRAIKKATVWHFVPWILGGQPSTWFLYYAYPERPSNEAKRRCNRHIMVHGTLCEFDLRELL